MIFYYSTKFHFIIIISFIVIGAAGTFHPSPPPPPLHPQAEPSSKSPGGIELIYAVGIQSSEILMRHFPLFHSFICTYVQFVTHVQFYFQNIVTNKYTYFLLSRHKIKKFGLNVFISTSFIAATSFSPSHRYSYASSNTLIL